jgi:hypothetical protein
VHKNRRSRRLGVYKKTSQRGKGERGERGEMGGKYEKYQSDTQAFYLLASFAKVGSIFTSFCLILLKFRFGFWILGHRRTLPKNFPKFHPNPTSRKTLSSFHKFHLNFHLFFKFIFVFYLVT